MFNRWKKDEDVNCEYIAMFEIEDYLTITNSPAFDIKKQHKILGQFQLQML